LRALNQKWLASRAASGAKYEALKPLPLLASTEANIGTEPLFSGCQEQ